MSSVELSNAIQNANAALLACQRHDGSWIGEVDLNPGPTAQAVMLHAALGLEFPKSLAPKAHHYIARTQNQDGGWPTFYGAPSDLSLACECYFALRLLGDSVESPAVARALLFIKKNGGLARANPWTQLYAAVLGVAPWESIHKTPIEIMLLPRWSLVQLEDLSYWVKAITIPMALLGELGPGKAISIAPELVRELGTDSSDWQKIQPDGLMARLFPLLARGVKKLPFNRGKAVKRAWDYIAGITEKHGDFGGNTCTAINVLLCMDRAGRRSDPAFKAGLEVFMGYAFEDENEWRLQTCQSHIWDTGFALNALIQNEVSRDAFRKGAAWLKSRQIRGVRGDWARNVKQAPGGWCFGNHHDRFPVTDCTALSLLGLVRAEASNLESETAKLAVDWLCGMQHAAGGWSAYEKYQRGRWLNSIIKFKDLENALVDVPKADVSAKVLEALCLWRDRHPEVEECLRRGREFLLNSRTPEGLWKGNYGVNSIYGTAFAVKALRKIDGVPRDEWAKPARRFFLERQNTDGGWGEVEASYRDSSLFGLGPSSPVQTSWVILLLLACENGENGIHTAVERGVDFLLKSQKASGGWDEPLFLGTVFPGMVYFRYEYYALYFPLMALTAASEFGVRR